ncbi:MAG: tRNA (adenosine(37)-N6)-threonylcarbamoyltransferase complex dimerization subunit type 1 TsaB [Nitrospirae bacterium]|nr:tRNA (adenosine(37)-N6)-threonylcarbamoyltransferase complex dimerization subunit type 1 TsaB [Nitrospirota bacterium]
MKILAIETSTMLGGVAIADEGGLIAEVRLNVRTTHSERLMTAVDYALQQSDMALAGIDAVAVASGPGSFTGLRIGLSTAKGLCYAADKPLVLVPTLEAFAWNFPCCAHPVCIMLDARKGEVYAAKFQWERDKFTTLVSAVSTRPEDFLRECRGPIVLAGEGVLRYRELIVSALGERAVIAPSPAMVPSPSNVARLGLQKALCSEFADAAAAEPVYVRRSEAEVQWSERH